MKLFKKKKETNEKQRCGAEEVAPLGPLRFSGPTVKKDLAVKASAAARSKEDAQRRFVNKLYQLSYAHGSNSVTTPPDLVKSESSPPAGIPSPTEPCSITPDSSPVRAKPASITRMVKSAAKDDDAGVVGTLGVFFNQITACTSDFFGEGIAGECVNTQDIQQQSTPRTAAIRYSPVPSTITFESAAAAAPPRKKPRETPLRTSILVDKLIAEGVNELDNIVERVERSTKKSSIAYKSPEPSIPGQSLIDNVWVVSSFPSEEKQQPPSAAMTEELSVTSSIPTRYSHRL